MSEVLRYYKWDVWNIAEFSSLLPKFSNISNIIRNS